MFIIHVIILFIMEIHIQSEIAHSFSTIFGDTGKVHDDSVTPKLVENLLC